MRHYWNWSKYKAWNLWNILVQKSSTLATKVPIVHCSGLKIKYGQNYKRDRPFLTFLDRNLEFEKYFNYDLTFSSCDSSQQQQWITIITLFTGLCVVWWGWWAHMRGREGPPHHTTVVTAGFHPSHPSPPPPPHQILNTTERKWRSVCCTG